ncbi:hypothetical protein LXL04_005214 [Taraxacum kok-saghyz]
MTYPPPPAPTPTPPSPRPLYIHITLRILHSAPPLSPSFINNFQPSSLKIQRFEMERLNSKLYVENCLIMQENEKLRRKAQLLNQENQALLSQLKQRLTMGDQNGNNAPHSIGDLNLSTSTSRKP